MCSAVRQHPESQIFPCIFNYQLSFQLQFKGTLVFLFKKVVLLQKKKMLWILIEYLLPFCDRSGIPNLVNFQTSFQFSSATQLCPTLCNPMNRSTSGLPVHHQLLQSTQTHVHCVGDAIQPSHPLLSPSPPALNLSQHQGLFKWVKCIRWPKYWNFSFDIYSLTNEHPGLISFRMDQMDLLAVQGTLKNLLQHHSSKASILLRPAFFIVQISHSFKIVHFRISNSIMDFILLSVTPFYAAHTQQPHFPSLTHKVLQNKNGQLRE